MDPASLTLGVVAAFKDVYFVSRYLYKFAYSAKHFREEQQALLMDFRQAFLYLKTFWRVIVPTDGKVAGDEQLDAVKSSQKNR